MALLRSKREATIPEVSLNEEDYHVLDLRRLTDHPMVQPLIARRAGLRQRREDLAQARHVVERALAQMEHAEAAALAAQGDTWAPPLAWREAQQSLQEIETQERMTRDALAMLEEQIEVALSEARTDVEQKLNALRRPLVAKMTKGLRGLVEVNQQLHAIEGKSNRLLQFCRWHLYDVGLNQRLHLMDRTQALLDAAGNAAVE